MNLQTEFSQQLALSLYESTEEFPVDLEQANKWLEYHDKSTAKRAFLKCGFVENLDYRISTEPTTTGISANPKQKLYMTVDAFKHWGIRYNIIECVVLIKNYVFNYRIFRKNHKMRSLWNIS